MCEKMRTCGADVASAATANPDNSLPNSFPIPYIDRMNIIENNITLILAEINDIPNIL